MKLKIASDYSETPGGRYITDGPFSGEEFRISLLEPAYLKCLALEEKLIIDLDGGYGYSPGFLEETFGGMVRLGYSRSELNSVIEFISLEEPDLVKEITQYMIEQEERNLQTTETL